MELWSLGILIIGIAVLIIAIFLVPALLQLKKTLKSAERFMDDMDVSIKSLVYDEVKPLVKSINDTMDEVEGIVKSARSSVEKLGAVVESVSAVGGTIRSINNLVDTKVKGALVDIAAYLVGIKVGIGTFVESIKSRSKKKEVA